MLSKVKANIVEDFSLELDIKKYYRLNSVLGLMFLAGPMVEDPWRVIWARQRNYFLYNPILEYDGNLNQVVFPWEGSYYIVEVPKVLTLFWLDKNQKLHKEIIRNNGEITQLIWCEYFFDRIQPKLHLMIEKSTYVDPRTVPIVSLEKLKNLLRNKRI